MVRDNIACTGQRGIYLQNSLRDVFKSAKGSIAEVNLLLVAMLRHAGLKADPVMLSTRDHGTVFTTYPMLSRFNYILASITIDGGTELLDASKSRLGYGRILPECYNGLGRIIDAAAGELPMMSDSLKEKKSTFVYLSSQDGSLDGSFRQEAGYFESYGIRKKLRENGKDAYFADIRSEMGNGIELLDGAIDSVDRFERPLSVRAKLHLPAIGEDLIYLNPMFGQGMAENPFKSPDRSYPVEMPYTIDESFFLTLNVPPGYEVDELPKSMRVHLNEAAEGSFDYLVSVSEGVISMRSQVKLKRANFLPEDYENLRAFFNMIVAKHKEQIVFKKKK